MHDSQSHNLDKTEIYILKEKIKRYGDPKRNLIITALIIVLISVLVAVFLLRKGTEGITADYADFYPDSTLIYIDADLTNKKIEEINKQSNFEIKSLPDLLSRIFADNYNIEQRKKINKLMSEAFGNNFSFGIWNDNANAKSKERSLVIFTLQREAKIKPLFELILGKNPKTADRNYKGFKITVTSDEKIAYCIIKDKLYIADSYETMIFTIKNSIINKGKSLYDRQDIKHVLGMLKSDRVGTILVSDFGLYISKLNELFGKKYKNEVNELEKITKLMNETAIAVSFNKNSLYFESYTHFDLEKIKDKALKHAYKVIFNDKYTNSMPAFLPDNTVNFVSVNNLKDYVNFMIEFAGIRQAPEFEQFKQFIKLLTSLDFDKDILELLKNDTVYAKVKLNDNKYENILVLNSNENTDFVMSKLVKIIPLQMPSVKISSTVYKKRDLGLISIPKSSLTLSYGKVSPDLYIIGEKTAVESLIDTVSGAKPEVIKSDIYKNLDKKNVENSRILAYLNVENFKEIDNRNLKIKNQIMINKIRNNIKALLFGINTKNDTIRTSLQLNLK